jgi:hypothetical protein
VQVTAPNTVFEIADQGGGTNEVANAAITGSCLLVITQLQ